MKHKLWKKISVGLLSLCMLTALVPTTAMAAPMPETGNLHIHKYELDLGLSGEANHGEEVTVPATAVPLAGIEFTVSKVAPAADGSYPAAPPVTSFDATFTAQTLTTNAAGEATFNDLPRGVYLVQETNSTVGGVTYAPVEDFLVAVPCTDAAGTGWMEDVHAYPKNQSMEPGKTVDGESTKPGDPSTEAGRTMEWSITTPIMPGVAKFQYYRITDNVDKLLNVDASSVKVYTVSAKDAAATENTAANLVADSNYTQTLSADNVLTVNFNTETGLGLLAARAAAGTANVRVVFTTTLTDEALGMLIENDAELDIRNAAGNDYHENIPEDKRPEVYTGAIVINKFGADNDRTAALAGAEFKVATTEANAISGTFLQDLNGNDIVATTDATGKAVLNGVPYGSAGVAPGDSSHSSTSFWIVETKAPAGYNLLPDPIEVGFDYDAVQETLISGQVITHNYFNKGISVFNTMGFTLPRTGASGIIISTIAGLALLSAVVIIIARRKTRQKTNR